MMEESKKIYSDFVIAACRLGEELLSKENRTCAEQDFLDALDRVVDNHAPQI